MNRLGLHASSPLGGWSAPLLLLAATPTLAAHVAAQTDYGHTDAGRPVRVEDAIATERYALDAQLAPLRFERTASGAERWRLEPKLSYGVLPRTEVELRTSLAFLPRQGDANPPRAGFTGVGISALHAFTLETPGTPALALAVDALAPVGSLAAPRATYAVKGMLTRSFRLARVHVNGALGTWNVAAPAAAADTCGTIGLRPPGSSPCGGPPVPLPPDVPCSVGVIPGDPSDDGVWLDRRRSELTRCGAPATPTAGAPQTTLRTTASSLHGNRWFVGAAADHAFAVHSVLLSADVYAERFAGLYDRTDWAAEVGVRHQLQPGVVVDAGVGRRFAGVNPATLGTLGLTLTVAARPLVR